MKAVIRMIDFKEFPQTLFAGIPIGLLGKKLISIILITKA
jgi:hypothetical protein